MLGCEFGTTAGVIRNISAGVSLLRSNVLIIALLFEGAVRIRVLLYRPGESVFRRILSDCKCGEGLLRPPQLVIIVHGKPAVNVLQ